MCDFKPGDEVVCVDDQWVGHGRCSKLGIACPLREGAVYTVSQVCPAIGLGIDGLVSVHPTVFFAEVRHPFAGRGFDARRFRKVHRKSTETGMSILRGLLDGEDVCAPVVEISV